MVLDDDAVESVYTGEFGLLRANVDGKLFADMSTILPDTVKRVAAAVSERGAGFVDAPVAGTVQPAREGRVLIFAGGHPADLERLQPVFSPLARRIDHLGPVGSGAAMKLVHNTLLATYWGVFAEGLAMGSAYGLDLRRMIEVIGESPAAFAALPVKVPLLLGQTAEIGFDIANVRKDLRTIHRFADSLDVPIHIADAALKNFEQAVQNGFGTQDVATIVRIQRGES
jgi:3-hydroxyisobutyrate dehydrogenase-like beta-hydroxyacid dehydrogenase